MKQKFICLVILLALVLLNFQSVLAAETVHLNDEAYLIEDYQRFQSLESPTVAVALSGGGARALVNIGVLKALIEEQVPIDLVTGTSMGSIIGTMYGSGLSIEQIEDIASKNPFAKLFNLNFTSNKSLLKTAQVNKFIEEIAPYKKLEDFPTPTALLSFDLTSGNKYLTTTGQISKVIQSSYSIPHYFPPYQKDNHYLIDPGIVEMSPAKSAKILGADFVIATTAFDKLPYKKYNTPSRSIGRFVNLMQQQNANKILNQYADIVINHDVSNYSFMDFTQAQKLIDIGYKTTMAKMPTIKKQLHANKIKINYQENRKMIDLTDEFELLRNDRLINNSLVLNPIFHTGKETNFLTHNILTTYFKQAEYGFQLEDGQLESKVLTTNNEAQDIDIQLRWKQLSPSTDFFFKSKFEVNNNSYSDFRTEIKYYQNKNNYSLGVGNIGHNPFLYAGSQYEFGPPREKTQGEVNAVISKENDLTAIFSQETIYNLSDIWQIKPKVVFNNTKIIPSPLIYRGDSVQEDTKLQAGIDFIYNHDFIDPIELNVLQLTNIRIYTFIDYKDTFENSYTYGLGNKTDFNLLGLKPIDIEAYIAYDNHTENIKSLVKLDYQF
ncbi:patatin-like phospholipase family protein [Halanaerobacter jeridensis]|uniref:NTE family protein n=1 Tax=Halanaerobacter jeridensis TaxID=706427 RepID=A0A939BPV2_9FIRM|nr:patatin-like phospholipase family protein [Halanaerobacter jeridensis]MBM7557333.1 NTE family protein [Halanaerobacter jeridensis]